MNEKVYELIREIAEANGLNPDLLLSQIGARRGPFPKDVCAMCGQAEPEERKVPLNRQLVSALWGVYRFLKKRNDGYTFRRREVSEAIKVAYGETATANFGYLIYFGGILFRPPGEGRGHWGMNLERVEAFFKGQLSLPSAVYLRQHTVTRRDPDITIDQVPSVSEFFDRAGEYQGWRVTGTFIAEPRLPYKNE